MFIGESSSLTFLVWKLSMKKDWEITVVLEDDSTLLMNADRQLTFHFGPNSFSVRPKLLASSLSDTLVGNIDSSFDYVFLSPMVGYDFSTYLSKIKRIVTRDTIILLDSCLFGERIVARVNCKYVSLIHSEIDCRKISSRKYYLNTNSKSFDFYVGRGCRGRKNNVMKELHAVYQSLEIGRWEFVSFLKINSLIFGKAVNLICIESLSLIFEQPNLLELGGNNSIALPMMKGLFQELSILLSLYKDKSGKNYINPLKLDLEGFILKEDSLRRQRQEIDKQSELGINFLDSPKMFYDFVQNFEIEIIPIISLLLDIADSVMFYTPVLESLLIFFKQINYH